MTIYKHLPESLILTPKQIQDFERLHIALGHMKAWLESHNYQNTTVEPVIIGKTSWLRRKEVLSVQYQRIYPLTIGVSVPGNTLYRTDRFAVNIDGELIVGSVISGINGNRHKTIVPNRPIYNAQWASAQYTGLRPDAIYDIVTAINQVTSQ